ncbi:MAG: hypothetical protein PHD15_06350 [Clostridia bacterium]|nr:hypothetical protein [Clostridia bacterium]MDD4387351.1 hypothetical protein [Clostridia bacterium]
MKEKRDKDVVSYSVMTVLILVLSLILSMFREGLAIIILILVIVSYIVICIKGYGEDNKKVLGFKLAIKTILLCLLWVLITFGVCFAGIVLTYK